MKMIVKGILFSTLAFGFTACSTSGWTSSQESEFMSACKQAGSMDCDCALDKTKKAYPNNADFNEKGGSDMKLAQELAEGCMK